MSAASPLLTEYLLRLGDDALVLGHRLSEWCTRGPTLEEDLAFANIALDYLGQAQFLLTEAARGQGRTADDLAYFRGPEEFKNAILAELPCDQDFGHALLRQFFFDSYRYELLQALQSSRDGFLAAFSEKALKESRYHLRHSSAWIIRLGDGTEESKTRLLRACVYLWPMAPELFQDDSLTIQLHAEGTAPLQTSLRDKWLEIIATVFSEATLPLPELSLKSDPYHGREGRHTEHLGEMLSEMQVLPRTFPDAKW